MNIEYIPLKKIANILMGLYQKKATGVLFITTQENRSAHIIFEKGEIISIRYFNKFGAVALGLMSSITSGRCRFRQGKVRTRHDKLPPTKEILLILSEFAQNTSPRITSQDTLTSIMEQRFILEECLTEYIGPVASLICEEVFSSHKNLQSILEALTKEIPDAERANRFKQEVIDKLRK